MWMLHGMKYSGNKHPPRFPPQCNWKQILKEKKVLCSENTGEMWSQATINEQPLEQVGQTPNLSDWPPKFGGGSTPSLPGVSSPCFRHVKMHEIDCQQQSRNQRSIRSSRSKKKSKGWLKDEGMERMTAGMLVVLLCCVE